MAHSLKDFDSSFEVLKKITIGTILLSFVLLLLLGGYILLQERRRSERIYVVTDLGTLPALRQAEREISLYEARNQVKLFLHTMFAHHAANYQQQLEAGLHLIDKAGGQRIVHDFSKGEVYQNYVRLGTQTSMQVDSVLIDMKARPIAGRAYARQTIHLGEKNGNSPSESALS
ncbi:conjugative transposon TraK protein [Cesiribacter andamanensis]|uniref:Conjugative transposon TraK protein n=1 Tax=Cesiribacter andamanensis AMV16 TaxID=1279009 RepID=M7NV29_9BACT|nr:conjugative transposon TraK protein [Cesiribacter andamanensis]EMR02304.1 conjugative transposon TraK protein [Cesiribacter andamanensis AMV16]